MIGCLVCFLIGISISSISSPVKQDLTGLTYDSFKEVSSDEFKIDWKKYYYVLGAWGVIITGICYAL